MLSIALSVAGVYIILGVGSGNISPAGVLASLGSVTFWSLASVFIRRISAEYDPVQISLYGMVLAFLCSVPAAGIELAIKPCSITPAAIASCLYLGIAGTAIAHTFWNKSIKILNASTCSMWYPLQPLVSALLGIVLLGEALTPQFLTGDSDLHRDPDHSGSEAGTEITDIRKNHTRQSYLLGDLRHGRLLISRKKNSRKYRCRCFLLFFYVDVCIF